MLVLVYFVTLIAFTFIFTREVVALASGASCDKRWRIYAGALNVANLVTVVVAGFLFDKYIAQHSLLNLQSHLDPVTAGFVAFLVASFFAYWWHRLAHVSNTLWRTIHQLHHSPHRIEALTAFYTHPLDALLAILLNASVASLLLGVNGISLTIAVICTTLFNLIAHADQRTPRWLGFITQRPEMHRVHHESGHHRQNYGLPIWDMIFGTLANPEFGPETCGFTRDKELRIRDMLLFKDVEGG